MYMCVSCVYVHMHKSHKFMNLCGICISRNKLKKRKKKKGKREKRVFHQSLNSRKNKVNLPNEIILFQHFPKLNK